jgi:Outer membrane lipoprotein carrier protein LolA-like
MRPGLAHPSLLDELMRRLASVPERRAVFEEEKTLAVLTEPLRSNGRLLYRRPAHLEKITYPPHAESLVIDGNRLAITVGDEPPRSVDLEGHPEIAALVDAMRATLAGDLTALQRSFSLQLDGSLAGWRLILGPRDGPTKRLLRRAEIEGAGDQVRTVIITQANGDRSVMTVHPVS